MLSAFVPMLFVGVALFGQVSGNLTLLMKDGNQKKIAMSTIGKINFASENMFVNYFIGSSDAYALSSIQSIVFNNALGFPKTEFDHRIQLFPNPVINVFTLKNLPDSEISATIFAADGSVVMNLAVASATGQVDVSRLPKGLYLLKVNRQVLKFTKR